MENWLFNRPKDHQREKIFHDVFVNGCFSGTSCAKNFRSSELIVAQAALFINPAPFDLNLLLFTEICFKTI